ncbi:EAL domain-containing protein [Undibacterium parvum]|uniref:EAL domain-containing protein n=1 Tax=Undibacterium parvum TaxID=401471 RepID=A0A3Q9BRB1_9BURK|nr:EAL domain-containing protein [Undibacterium parvum]AZP12533.1 EAL domain-containing protein [Undibacterium parvum]
MQHQALQTYLNQLQHHTQTEGASNFWLDEQGRARGRYVNASLTSAFQAIRSGDDNQIIAYEAYARSYSADELGLNVWKLLDYAASDDESVALDRLCRLLHAINFFRQPESQQLDLYLSVHSRLLAAVTGNHGMAFRRVLDALELPHQSIVLQLPLITPSQRWVLTHVAENYKRNGFRVGANAANLAQALDVLARIRPTSIKLDIEQAGTDTHRLSQLLEQAEAQDCRIIFKRIATEREFSQLQNTLSGSAKPYQVQGFLFDRPKASLGPQRYARAYAFAHEQLLATSEAQVGG